MIFKVLKICFPFNHCNFHLYWAAAVTFEWVATACLYCPTAVFGGHWKWNCSSKTKNYLSSKNLVHISLILSTFSRKCEEIFSDHFFFFFFCELLRYFPSLSWNFEFLWVSFIFPDRLKMKRIRARKKTSG